MVINKVMNHYELVYNSLIYRNIKRQPVYSCLLSIVSEKLAN